jgi:transposase-like protein
LGVDHTNISRWVRQYRKQIEKPTQNYGSVKKMEDELKRLKKENKSLLMEREILKKAAAFLCERIEVRCVLPAGVLNFSRRTVLL